MLGYLEKHCADAYRREFDQDENVIRSLPFFVAALTLQLALLAQIVRHLPPLELSWFAATLHILLLLAGFAFAATLVLMYLATAQREFRYTPPEGQVVAWAINQRRAYVDAGFPRPEVDEVVEEELKEKLAAEFAAAAEHNRANNIIRLRFRAYALASLMAALLLALVMGTIIFADHLASNLGAKAAANEPQVEEPVREGRSAGSSAPSAAQRDGSVRRDDPKGASQDSAGSSPPDQSRRGANGAGDGQGGSSHRAGQNSGELSEWTERVSPTSDGEPRD